MDTQVVFVSSGNWVRCWLAVMVGGGATLFVANYFWQRPIAGPVVLALQRGGPTIQFDLPKGWSIIYNGHQNWRAGTVVDERGQPRIDVSMVELPPAGGGVFAPIQFAWGQADLRTEKTTQGSPFNSVGGPRGVVWVIQRTYKLAHGALLFRTIAQEDAALQPVINHCMNTLRQST